MFNIMIKTKTIFMTSLILVEVVTAIYENFFCFTKSDNVRIELNRTAIYTNAFKLSRFSRFLLENKINVAICRRLNDEDLRQCSMEEILLMIDKHLSTKKLSLNFQVLISLFFTETRIDDNLMTLVLNSTKKPSSKPCDKLSVSCHRSK
ncbi:CLUMA_CG010869, isoform A [Clunio marinus]|uniref:CLUMA_CG010869, isoform A n=1 Tax=Clunio marinus TaxID=568069 RepID=A0A1J1IB71_9DIPT|nr:CLUMA_CG010869, isoform A [Clunio marinus]